MTFEYLSAKFCDLVNYTLHSQFFLTHGLIVLLLYAATPSIIAMPSEVLASELITNASDKIEAAFKVIFVTSLGGLLGDTLIYYGFKHGRSLISKPKPKAMQEGKHWIHKLKNSVFIISPSLFFLPGLPDAFLAYAGIRHWKYEHLVLQLLLGNVIRSTWGTILLLNGFNLQAICN